MIPKTCDEIVTEFKLKPGCCESCHEDYDEYGYTMIELYEDWDGIDAIICCQVSRELDKKKENHMASKAELQEILENTKRNIEEFKTDARQARGNMGGLLDNLAAGMKGLQTVLEGLVARLDDRATETPTGKSDS